MFYIAMAIALLLLLLSAFNMEKRDIFSPAVLCVGGMFLSTLFALVGRLTWNNIDISFHTAFIVCMGCLAFFIGSSLVEYLDLKTMGSSKSKVQRYFMIGRWKYCVLIALILLALLFRVMDTYRIAGELGIISDNFNLMSKSVRDATANFLPAAEKDQVVDFSVMTKQLDKLSKAVGYVALFVLALEISARRFKRDKVQRAISIILPAVVVLLDFVYVLVCGGRTQIMYMGIAFAAMLFMLYADRSEERLELSIRALGLILVVGIFAIGAFYFAGYLIGREPSGGIVDYTTFYFGGGAPSLDKLLHDFETLSKCDGATFYNMRAFLAKFGILAAPGSSSIVWVGFPGHLSNIFTAFGGLYIDFGLLGMVVLTIVSGVICTGIYAMGRKHHSPYILLLYGYLAPSLFDMARIVFVYYSLLSVNQLMIICMMMALLWFMIREITNHDNDAVSDVEE